MKDLVQIIRDNPGCVATIDNDYWCLSRDHGSAAPDDPDLCDAWDADNTLVSSDDKIKPLGDGGYGSGVTYGGDILQALAVIVGIKVESV